MHYFIFPSADAWITSGSSQIDGTSFKDQNFGQDQILELKKHYQNRAFKHQTRILVNFAGTSFDELKTLVDKGTIPSNTRYYLKMFDLVEVHLLDLLHSNFAKLVMLLAN